MNLKKLLISCSVVLAASSNSFAQTDEVSEFRSISGILSGATVDNVAIFSAEGWGAPSCPTATLLAVDSNSPGYKNNYAAVLTARALDAKVRAFGRCVAGTPFFVITTLELQ